MLVYDMSLDFKSKYPLSESLKLSVLKDANIIVLWLPISIFITTFNLRNNKTQMYRKFQEK